MKGNLTDQCIGLAAIAQSAMLVHNKAHSRISHEHYTKAMLDSIFVLSPDSVRDVYPEPDDLKLGLETACAMLSNPDQSLVPVLQYSLTLIDIGQRLQRQPQLTARLGKGLEDIDRMRADLDQGSLVQQLSQLYQDTISTLTVRVQVRGSAEALQRTEVADHIRALLLAGVRAAWLWRQTGGRRWHLLFRRGSIRRHLAQLTPAPSIQ